MKFKEVIKEKLITKDELLEQLLKRFLKDAEFLEEDAVDIYSQIFGYEELFEAAYKEGELLTEAFEMKEAGDQDLVGAFNSARKEQSSGNVVGRAMSRSNAAEQISLENGPGRKLLRAFGKVQDNPSPQNLDTAATLMHQVIPATKGVVVPEDLQKIAQKISGSDEISFPEILKATSSVVDVPVSELKVGLDLSGVHSAASGLNLGVGKVRMPHGSGLEKVGQAAPDVSSDAVDNMWAGHRARSYTTTAGSSADNMASAQAAGKHAANAAADTATATHGTATTAASVAADHAPTTAGAAGEAAKGAANGGFLANILSGIKGLGTGLAAKLQALSGKPGTAGWLKNLLSGGGNWLAANPLGVALIPLAAIAGLVGAKKIINRIRQKKGMARLTAAQFRKMEDLVRQKKAEINRVKSQMNAV